MMSTANRVSFLWDNNSKCLYPKCIVRCAIIPRIEEQQLKGFFERYDKNGDGLLSKEELKEAFKHLGALIPGWRVWWGLHYADANGDGYISEGELDALVNYAASLGYTVK